LVQVKIYISPKQGIHDPQGQATENALKHLGFNSTSGVRVGKYITFEVENGISEEEIHEMCKKLLANPIIEDYSFEVSSD